MRTVLARQFGISSATPFSYKQEGRDKSSHRQETSEKQFGNIRVTSPRGLTAIENLNMV